MKWASVENKLLLTSIALVTGLLLVAGLWLSMTLVNAQQQQYQRQHRVLASTVAVGVSHQIDQPYSPRLKLKQYLVQVMHQTPVIREITVTSQGGQTLAHAVQPASQASRSGVFSEGASPRRSGLLTVATPLPSPHSVKVMQGTVTLLLDVEKEAADSANLPGMIWLVIVGAWLIACGAMVRYTVTLSKHIRTVVDVVQQVGTGQFGVTMDDQRLWGDLKVLARAFNDMSMRLRLYQNDNIESLTIARNKLQSVVLSIADGVIVCDNEHKAILVNPAAVTMLGLKDYNTLLGCDLSDYMTVDGKKPFDTCLDAFHQQQDSMTITETIKLMHTSLRVILSPMLDANQARLGYVLTLHDVTREIEIDQLKTSFIANVSHELRTPVTTIKTYIDTLCQHGEDLDPDTYKEFMDTLNVETDRLKRLVNDVLDVSRLQEGVELYMTIEEVGPIVQLTVQSLKVLADQKNITISTNIETDLPKTLMNADSIERVVRNLLSNAIKYTPEGGRVRCRTELVNNGTQIEVRVEDNGIGIPPEHLPHIFDRFYRVENAVHTVKGTGLGLHLVKLTIEDYHHGEVFVTSTPSQGSVFGFRLPVTSGVSTPGDGGTHDLNTIITPMISFPGILS
jgi:PAS domain S-box-containing protein